MFQDLLRVMGETQGRTLMYCLGVLVLDYLIRAFHHYAEALRMPPLDGVLIESPY